MAAKKARSARAIRADYDRATKEILAALESIPNVKAPPQEYLAALKRAQEQVENWFDASLDAARDDVKRWEGD